jgi:glyoxylase-like metal-dependent hydrolase (beta-lactamase superfamily II)
MPPLLIPAFNPGPHTGSGNNTYLLPGPEPVLIDAGVGRTEHLDALARALAGAPLATVVVTHIHADHASGVEAIAARWPGAVFLKSLWPERDARYAVPWKPIRDGDAIDTGEGRIEVLRTPGHSPDHVCLYEPAGRVLFGGDLLRRGGTVVIPASHGGSLAAYLDSLERVRALAPVRVLPAHGSEIDDPETLVREYLDHRREREAQIVEALRAGATTPEAIVARVYAGLSDALIGFAQESVLAHLVKLEREHRATQDDAGTWTVSGAGV